LPLMVPGRVHFHEFFIFFGAIFPFGYMMCAE